MPDTYTSAPAAGPAATRTGCVLPQVYIVAADTVPPAVSFTTKVLASAVAVSFALPKCTVPVKLPTTTMSPFASTTTPSPVALAPAASVHVCVQTHLPSEAWSLATKAPGPARVPPSSVSLHTRSSAPATEPVT